MALVRFFLLYRDAVFTSFVFFQTANISHRTLCLTLFFFGIHSAAASIWVLTKFSYSSFGVNVSDNSWRASTMFLSVIVYLLLISLLLSNRVWFWLFASYFGVGLDVSLLWEFCDRKRQLLKRNMANNSERYWPISYLWRCNLSVP